jgi:tryptophan synthase beta subunit
VEYTSATDDEAIDAFHLLAATEGILPALESAHAVAETIKRAPRLGPKKLVLVNLSGRGDKDVESVLEFDARRRERDEAHDGAAEAGGAAAEVTPIAGRRRRGEEER